MKVLITYYSETGNTEKVARAIYDEVSMKHEADLKTVEEIAVDILSDYDFVFLGSACHSSDLANPAKRILNSIPDSPNFKLAGFFTHATYPAANHNKDRNLLFNKWAAKCVTSLLEMSKEKQIDYKGYLVLANIDDSGTPYPMRVQWCDTGNIENWSTGNSGSEDLVEEGEEIKGIGRLGE